MNMVMELTDGSLIEYFEGSLEKSLKNFHDASFMIWDKHWIMFYLSVLDLGIIVQKMLIMVDL